MVCAVFVASEGDWVVVEWQVRGKWAPLGIGRGRVQVLRQAQDDMILVDGWFVVSSSQVRAIGLWGRGR